MFAAFVEKPLKKVTIQLVDTASSLLSVNIINDSNICIKNFLLLADDIFDGKWLMANVCNEAFLVIGFTVMRELLVENFKWFFMLTDFYFSSELIVNGKNAASLSI